MPDPNAPTKPLVIVEVSGGVVQEVYSDTARVILVDWDNIREGDEAGEYPVASLAAVPAETASAIEASGAICDVSADVVAAAEAGTPAQQTPPAQQTQAGTPAKQTFPGPPVDRDAGGLLCRHCGGRDFRYVEDIQNWREVIGLQAGTLTIDGLYHTGEGYDDGDNPRLQCANCCSEFPVPDDVAVEFE
jgi:hypothetical protein